MFTASNQQRKKKRMDIGWFYVKNQSAKCVEETVQQHINVSNVMYHCILYVWKCITKINKSYNLNIFINIYIFNYIFNIMVNSIYSNIELLKTFFFLVYTFFMYLYFQCSVLLLSVFGAITFGVQYLHFQCSVL